MAAGKLTKWRDEFYVQTFEGARAGLKAAEVAARLGVGCAAFNKWLERKPALKDAWVRGRAEAPVRGTKTFLDYAYRNLPDRLKEVWDRVVELEANGSPASLVEALVNRQGMLAKQHLFVHALVSSNFSVSSACGRLGVSYTEFEKWKRDDPDFLDLVRFVLRDVKKDFVEGHLLRLVERGDSPATVHAARTLLADRGYGNRLKVEGEVRHHHLHEEVDVELGEVLDQLPAEEQARVLDRLREKKARLPPKEVG